MSLLKIQRNRQHDILCLMTNTWANRRAIVSSVITKIFNPCKILDGHDSTFCLHIHCISTCFIHCQSLLFNCCLIFICSALLLFASLCSTIQSLINRLFSVFFCSDSGIVFQVFNPHNNNHLAVNKHCTSDSAIFCLSIGSESLLPSYTLVEYPEPISPCRLSRG